MKTIKLNEKQLFKLIETKGVSAPSFDNGDICEFPGSQVTTTSNVHNADGDIEYGKQPTSDDVQDMLALQNFWANGRRGTRPM